MRNRFSKFLAVLLIALTLSGAAIATTIPLQTGPVDPSGLRGTINALITSINGYLNGSSSFSALVTSTLGLTGSTSGTTTLAASATASGTATFPAATDTVVELTQTQTLTNKTLTSPTISGATLAGTTAVTGPVTTQGQAFSTVPSGNPLMLETVQEVPVASINAAGGYFFLASAASRTIYPSAITLTAVGGSASAATREEVLCGSGNILASIPVAYLLNSTPVTPFSSTLNPQYSGGLGFTGCAAGDGVYISNVGSNLATTTNVWVNLIYTVQ